MSILDQLLAGINGAAGGGLNAYRAADETRARRGKELQDDAEQFNAYQFGVTREENDAKQFAEQQKVREDAEERARLAQQAREAMDAAKEARALADQARRDDDSKSQRRLDDSRARKLEADAKYLMARIDALGRKDAEGSGSGVGGGGVSGGNTAPMPGALEDGPAQMERLKKDIEALTAGISTTRQIVTGTKSQTSDPDIAGDTTAKPLLLRLQNTARAKADTLQRGQAAGLSSPARAYKPTPEGVGGTVTREANLIAETSKLRVPYEQVFQNPNASPEQRAQAKQAIDIINAEMARGVLQYRLDNKALSTRKP